MRNSTKDVIRDLSVIITVILFIFLACVAVGCVLDKISCEQKQDYHNRWDYEYHFPAGCLTKPKEQ